LIPYLNWSLRDGLRRRMEKDYLDVRGWIRYWGVNLQIDFLGSIGSGTIGEDD
jgi:hypothetical protein